MYSSDPVGSRIRWVTEDTSPEIGATAVPSGAALLAERSDRRERLKQVFLEARACTRCPQLVAARTQVVFGAGASDAALMFVGEAPTAREDERGVPFTGAAGKLLDDLLGSIGLAREDVFVTTALKCRPPGNRDADRGELERCRPYLHQQVALVEPRVICTLGDFATRLLRPDGRSLTEVHGRVEVVRVGTRAVHLLPLFHPAAALYTRSLLDTLMEDFARLPELLARPAPAQPEADEPDLAVAPEAPVEAEREPELDVPGVAEVVDEPARDTDDDSQLGLF